MRLYELLSPWVSVFPPSLTDVNCTYLAQDHRKVQPGTLFIAVKGKKFDGHRQIQEAFLRGAVAVLVNRDSIDLCSDPRCIGVHETREVLAPLAARFYLYPSRQLFAVGVTGTNGKTSTAYLIEHLLNKMNHPTGVIGTVDHHLLHHVWHTELTTPGPLDLQSRLAEFVHLGAKGLVMEVSSHSLDQKRVAQIDFDVAVFTNLTRDHLDYHGDFDGYRKAKEKLFTEVLYQSVKKNKVAVINADDPFAATLNLSPAVQRWTFGVKGDFHISQIQLHPTLTTFSIRGHLGSSRIKLPLCGKHNVYNAVGALLAVVAKFPDQWETLIHELASFGGVPGRLQLVPNSKHIPVYVDYAHTPDALENVLQALREIQRQSSSRGKLICLFGCGGDRDAGKRPLMAQVALRFSDQVMVTSDNPRTESPEKIIDDIFTGIDSSEHHRVRRQEDRRTAITDVLKKAQIQDVVLIAGKGHEDYQIIGTEKKPFNDVEIVKEVLG